MRAITETEPGGEMVCILDFSARPYELSTQDKQRTRRAFRVGERVRYVSHFVKASPEDNPVGAMAVFKPLGPGDETRYAATQDYFVTPDCWEGLREHFAGKLVLTDRDCLATTE